MITPVDSLKLPVFSFGNAHVCAYCGDKEATDRDHVVAVSFQHVHKECRYECNGPWCWACRDCNRAIKNRYFDSFKDRCEWTHDRLAAKLQPIKWHKWELNELDKDFRGYIERDVHKRKRLWDRADFYQSRDFYLNLESLIWEVSQLSGNGTGSKFLIGFFHSILYDIGNIYRPKD